MGELVKPGAVAHCGRGAMIKVVEPFLHSVLSLEAPGSSKDTMTELTRALGNIHAIDVSIQKATDLLAREECGPPRAKLALRNRIAELEAHKRSEQVVVHAATRALGARK